VKAIILAAGETKTSYGFPPDSKPKCLFHVDGKVLLKGIVDSLREGGVSDISIVVGYKNRQIWTFDKEHDLGLKFIYNPRWEVDAVHSLIIGLEGVEDDVLIMYSDIRFEPSLVEAFLKSDKPITLATVVPVIKPDGYGFAGILRVSKDMINIFQIPYPRQPNQVQGIRLAHFITHEAIRPHSKEREGQVKVIQWAVPISDTDYYNMTDEHRRLSN